MINRELVKEFEKKLMRTLSSLELQIINAWIDGGYSKEMILSALNEAICNGEDNLRYVDKILYASKKNSKNTNEMNNEFTVMESHLNSKLNFENFTTGVTNKFAKKVALTVAEQPGNMYNPLFIHGKTGLGKTHLINAIGNYIKQNSNKLVLYITCNQLIDDVMKLDENSFKQKYSFVDVLLLDDLQDIKASNKTQQILMNIIKNMISTEKQVVVTSNAITEDLNEIDDKLKNLLGFGMSVSIYSNL